MAGKKGTLMRKALLAALIGALLTAGCARVSNSRLNPFNWFGSSREVAVTAPVPELAADPRPLVDQVITLAVEPMPGGAIVRATGLPQTQGYWEAELLEQPVEDGRLTFRFVVIPPREARRVSTQQSREVTVATFVSNIRLEGIREITVQGAQNARSSRR